eukprot:2559887-Prorocentrum_lima.AAC.1
MIAVASLCGRLFWAAGTLRREETKSYTEESFVEIEGAKAAGFRARFVGVRLSTNMCYLVAWNVQNVVVTWIFQRRSTGTRTDPHCEGRPAGSFVELYRHRFGTCTADC